MPEPQEKFSYATVLRAPHAARTFGAALIGRFSYGVVFLSMVLAVTRSTGSYAVAGIFMALFGLASALLSPLRAAVVDRFGLRRALPPMTLTYALLLMGIAAATWGSGTPTTVLWVLGAAAGSFTPPLGPIMRTLWRGMLDGALLQRAYSLDTVAEELLYVAGPLLAGAFAAFVRPAVGVAVSAVLVLTGALLLLASPAVPVTQEPVVVRRGPTEPQPPAVIVPVLVSAGVGMCLGAVNLLVVAFAGRHHHLAAVAWVEAAMSVGSVLGGLVYGAATWRAAPRVRLSLLAGALGTAVAAAGLSANIVVLSILMAVAGSFVSPALATAYLAADEAAPAHARTRAGAWVNTGFNVGNSGGAAGLGLLVATLPLAICFVVAAAPTVLAAAVPLARGSRPPGGSPVHPPAVAATERG